MTVSSMNMFTPMKYAYDISLAVLALWGSQLCLTLVQRWIKVGGSCWDPSVGIRAGTPAVAMEIRVGSSRWNPSVGTRASDEKTCIKLPKSKLPNTELTSSHRSCAVE